MFIAALFVIAPNWKQFKCTSTVEWIKQKIYDQDIRVITSSENE